VDAAGCEQGQLHIISGSQRQLLVGARVDHLADLRRLRLQQGRRGSHLDRLLHVSNRKREIEARHLVQFERYIRNGRNLKSRVFDLHVIDADREARQIVNALAIGRSRPLGSAIRIGRGHLCIHYSGAGRVGNAAGNGGRNLLSPG